MSTEDGSGLRTTLFAKGCPLACKWCHNPESISFKMQNEWIKVRCLGCLSAIAVQEAAQLLARLKTAGVHTAVDTSGFCNKADIDNVPGYTDLFLYDIKIADSTKHKRHTGMPNEIIIDNFNYLVALTQGTDKKYGCERR